MHSDARARALTPNAEGDEHPREAEERDQRRDDQRAGQDREHDAGVEQTEDATPQLVGQRPLQQRHREHVDRSRARPGHDHQRRGDDRAVHQAQRRHRERGEADAGEQRGREAAARRQAVDQRRRDHPARAERAEQVAVAASVGAEPLVRDEHEGDRLCAVDERHPEQERGEDPGAGGPADLAHPFEEVGHERPGLAARPSSVCSARGSRRSPNVSRSAGARNVSEFTVNANTGEVTASSAAPTAGPITIVRFSTSVFRAFAAARSSSPTSVGVIAIIAGTYAVPNAVVANASSVTSEDRTVRRCRHGQRGHRDRPAGRRTRS